MQRYLSAIVLGSLGCAVVTSHGAAQDAPGAPATADSPDGETAATDVGGDTPPPVESGEDLLETASPQLPIPARPRPIVMTISGGASLGAYEAGVVHYSIEALRTEQERVDPLVFAGTSAGSINAFIAALTHCTEPSRDPEDSPLFRTWAAVGINELYDPERVEANAVFTRDAFQNAVGSLRRKWRQGFRENCDVLLGITATRMQPRDVVVEEGVLVLPRMSERFLVRIRGRGPGRSPEVSNFVEPSLGLERPLLPLDGEGVNAFDSLVQAVLASSAFPVAFAPQPIAHCILESRDGQECRPEDATEALFLDGGFYANQPLGLALDAARTGLAGLDGRGLLDAPTRRDETPADTVFYFIDPEFNAFPDPESEEERLAEQDVIPFALQMAGDFIRTARTAELDTVLEQVPSARKQLFTNRVHYPPASVALGAFFGFFDREFRRFDFHLGMYDARRTLAERVPRDENGEGGWDSFPDERERPDDDLGWRPYDCMRHVFDGVGSEASCAGEGLRDFRVLLRVSLERLWDVCLSTEGQGAMCEAARAGREIPDVPFLQIEGDYRSREGEVHYDWMLRRLATLGFGFRDLGLDPSRADEGGPRVRELLASMTRQLSRAQNNLSLPIELATETLINAFDYVPPKNLVSVGFGTGVEVGWSGTLPGTMWEWFRLTASLDFRGISSLISSQPSYFAFAPMLGLEFEAIPLSGSIIQPRLGIRGGYLLSTADGMHGGTCDVTQESVLPCSRPVFQGYLSLAFFQILQIRIIGDVMPAIRQNEDDLWEIRPGIALAIPLG